MEENARLRKRVEEFAAELQDEFGLLSPDEPGCLLSSGTQAARGDALHLVCL